MGVATSPSVVTAVAAVTVKTALSRTFERIDVIFGVELRQQAIHCYRPSEIGESD